MASFFTLCQWTPNPVGALPALTQLAFQITPGAFADEGITVEYVLHSTRARFNAAPAPPALLADEQSGSQPTKPDLVPKDRMAIIVVDKYPDAKAGVTVSIVRALSLAEIQHPSPGIATMTVTVSDLKFGGIPTGSTVDVVTISL